MAASAILVTGMSGVGKSAALRELAGRGYETVDTDEGEWITIVDGEPLWRIDLVAELLDRPRESALFVQGTVANQGELYDRFNAVVLMSAPLEVMLARVAGRKGYGSSVADREKIARDRAEFEPVLRLGATHEIDTTVSVTDAADLLVRIAEASQA